MDSLDIIESHIGTDLSESYAKRFLVAPASHIGDIIEKLAPYFFNWLENAEKGSPPPSLDLWLPIEALPLEKDWRKSLDRVRQLLLYAPKLAIPDPLAGVFWAPITAALFQSRISGGGPVSIPITDEVRKDFVDALILLSKLRKAIKRGHVLLLPAPFCIDYESVQTAAKKELEAIDKEDRDAYYKPILDSAAACGTDSNRASMVVERVKVYGQICARLQLTPVAGDVLVREILNQDYQRCGSILRAANISHSVCQALLQYEVPGVKADIGEVIRLREDEDAFRDWRKDFGDVISRAYQYSTNDEQQFHVEMRAYADQLLLPRIEQLNAVTKVSLLQAMFIPSATALGAATIAYYGAGLSTFPPVPLAAAGLAPLSWLVQKVIRTYNKSGRKATKLRELYAYMVQR